MSRVLVFGSVNMDLVVETSTFPRLGETLPGASFATHAGGKGANQAVAAARLGANVTMIGRVGSDAFGRELKARLGAEGVATGWVHETQGVSTGIAAITVCNADNAIVVVSGANARLSAADLDSAEPAFAQADVVLAQLEVPLATVEHGAELAARHGKPFVLNPAPAMRLPESLLARCTLITPNEYELGTSLAQPEVRWQELLTSSAGPCGRHQRSGGRLLHRRGGCPAASARFCGQAGRYHRGGRHLQRRIGGVLGSRTRRGRAPRLSGRRPLGDQAWRAGQYADARRAR